MLKSSRSKCKGGFFLWAEAAEAEAPITAHIIQVLIRTVQDQADLLTGLPVLHIRITHAQADLTIPAVTAVVAEAAAAQDAALSSA